MKIRKIISTRVYKRFKLTVCVFFGLIAINYLADVGVSDMMKAISDDADLSDYNIFVNADGDMVEEGEQLLLESTDFYGYDFDEDHRRMLEVKGNERSSNSIDTAGNSKCLNLNKLESTPGET